MNAGLNLGIGLVVAGLLLAVLAWGLLWLLPRMMRSTATDPDTFAAADPGDEGILVLEHGGRVDFANARVRDWFGLQAGESPDLEKLLRRIRPSDDFLELCAVPGQRRLNLNGVPVEVSSHRVPGSRPQMLLSLRTIELAPSMAVGQAEVASSVLRVIADFGSAITSSLDLESVI